MREPKDATIRAEYPSGNTFEGVEKCLEKLRGGSSYCYRGVNLWLASDGRLSPHTTAANAGEPAYRLQLAPTGREACGAAGRPVEAHRRVRERQGARSVPGPHRRFALPASRHHFA